MSIKFKKLPKQTNNNNFLPPEGTHFARGFKMIHVRRKTIRVSRRKET